MLYQPSLSQPRSFHQQRVDELMLKAGQELPTSPRIPAESIRLLRAKLALEECLETIRALGFNPKIPVCEPSPKDGMPITIQDVLFIPIRNYDEDSITNLIEIVDGCADTSVVNTGTLSACGIADMPILEAVDENNLQKFAAPACPGCEAPEPMEFINKRWYCRSCHTTADRNHGPYRREDGKWIKPPGHQPPDLRSLIIAQMGK